VVSGNLMRVFIAVDITDSTVLSNLSRVRDMLLSTGADLKPVATENMHITIRFIGETPIPLVNSICRELGSLEEPAFKVRVKGLGVFPNISRPHVIWAGVSNGFNELVSLHEKVEKILRKLGIPPDREKFIPHITLARVRTERNLAKLIKAINDLASVEFGEFMVEEVVLKRSTLTPSGPIYSNICGVKLKR